MSKVKRQHYVPREYLKRWANKKGQIYLLDKTTNKIFTNNITQVASEKYFYDGELLPEAKEEIRQFAKEEGFEKEIEPYIKNNQTTEFMITKIEGHVSGTIENIINRLNNVKAFPQEYLMSNRLILPQEYIDLAYFISLQAVRTKEFRKMLDELQEGLVKKISKFIPGITDDIGKYDLKITDEHSQYMHISQMFSLAGELTEIILNHKWIIQRRVGNLKFITSDHPVVKYRYIKDPYSGIGFASYGVEIHYPISPDYEILIYEPSYLRKINSVLANNDLHIVDSKNETVVHSNDLQVYYSNRQLFALNKEDFSLAQKRISETPEVNSKNRVKFN